MEPSQGLIDARESGGFAQVGQGIRLRRHHFVEKLFVKLESPPWLTQFHLVVSLCPERDKNLAVKRSPLGGIVLRVLQNRQGGIYPFFRFTGPVKIAERIRGVRQHHRQIASRHQPIPDLFEPADRQVEHRESSLRIPVPQDIAKRVAGVADAGSTRGVDGIFEGRRLGNVESLLEGFDRLRGPVEIGSAVFSQDETFPQENAVQVEHSRGLVWISRVLDDLPSLLDRLECAFQVTLVPERIGKDAQATGHRGPRRRNRSSKFHGAPRVANRVVVEMHVHASQGQIDVGSHGLPTLDLRSIGLKQKRVEARSRLFCMSQRVRAPMLLFGQNHAIVCNHARTKQCTSILGTGPQYGFHQRICLFQTQLGLCRLTQVELVGDALNTPHAPVSFPNFLGQIQVPPRIGGEVFQVFY